MVSPKFLPTLGIVAVCGLVFSGDVMARFSYCCNDIGGRLVCGDALPPACQNRAYRIKDEKGQLVREVDAPLNPEQKAMREAEKVRKEAEEKRLAEQKRRDTAMLATYPSEKDIDIARDRTLADFDKASGEGQKRFDAVAKRKKQLDTEKEFYVKKPMPANLKKQIEDTDAELKTLQEATASRKTERDALNATFDEEKARYMELRYGKVNREADAPPPAPAKVPPKVYKAQKVYKEAPAR